MGAYLYYKLSDKKQADEYNKFISETDNGKRLIKAEHLIAVYDSSDIEWAEKNRPDMIGFFKEQIGKGDFKASGIFVEEVENAGCKNLNEFFELVTEAFVIAQTKYKMWFAARSCAFNLDGTYFSIDQMKRITQNGKRLKKSSSDPEKYQKLFFKYSPELYNSKNSLSACFLVLNFVLKLYNAWIRSTFA